MPKNKAPRLKFSPSRLRGLFILALFATILVIVLDLSGLTAPFHFDAYDLMSRVRAMTADESAASRVVIVAVDDRTLGEPKFRAPAAFWPDYYGPAIKGLADAGAMAIGIHFVLPQDLFDDRVPGYSQTWIEALAYAREKKTLPVLGLFQTPTWRVVPAPPFLEAAGAGSTGLLNPTPDSDGVCRRQTMVFTPNDGAGPGAPSMALALARAASPGFQPPAPAVPITYRPPAAAFERHSFADLYARVEAGDAAWLKEQFLGRVVLIGAADSVADRPYPIVRVGNGPATASGLEVTAHTLRTLLDGDVIFEMSPPLAYLIYEILALIAAALTLLPVKPRPALYALGLAVLWSAGSLALAATGVFMPLAGGVIVILLTPVVAGTFSPRAAAVPAAGPGDEAESPEFVRQLGLELQKYGLLDAAFDKFRRAPVDARMKENLYTLAQEYQKKRSFKKALTVFEHLQEMDPKYRDVETQINNAKAASRDTVMGLRARTAEQGGMPGAPPTLGRYEIIEEIGRGAMGTVYLGQDPKIGRPTAIKTILFTEHYEKDEEDEAKERFFHEAETAGRLSHPNIVTIYDVGEEGDLGYIAMELLEGKPMDEYTLKKTLLPVRQVIDVTAAVAEALDYAHQNGVVHRDIKPDNIVLLAGGDPKITDFGVARAMATSKTKTGTKKGTPFYMSPEQIMGRKVDGRSDIFSLGVLLYELLTGRQPYMASEMAELVTKITTVQPTPVTEINPKAPRALQQILDKAMAKDRDDRYQSAGQMAQHLRQLGQKMDEIAAKRRTAPPPEGEA